MIGLVFCFSMAVSDGFPLGEAVAAPETAALVRSVEALLAGEPNLLAAHRGYTKFLDEIPALREAEQAYLGLFSMPGFQGVVRDLEQAISEDPRLKPAFEAFNRYLSENATARGHVDGLQRIEFEEGRARRAVREGIAFLRAHPRKAIPFLRNPPSVVPTPDALYPLRNQFLHEPTLRPKLLDAFEGLGGLSGAGQFIFPLWQRIYGGQDAASRSYEGLIDYFSKRPGLYGVWQDRERAWSSVPHAKRWADGLLQRFRDQTAFGNSYFRYQGLLNRNPELRRDRALAWEMRLGAAPPWPPEGTPKVLRRRIESESEAIRAPRRPPASGMAPPHPQRPERPVLSLPRRPTPPSRAKAKTQH